MKNEFGLKMEDEDITKLELAVLERTLRYGIYSEIPEEDPELSSEIVEIHSRLRKRRITDNSVKYLRKNVNKDSEQVYIFLGYAKNGRQMYIAIKYQDEKQLSELKKSINNSFNSKLNQNGEYIFQAQLFNVKVLECHSRMSEKNLENIIKKIPDVKLETTMVTAEQGNTAKDAIIRGIQAYFLEQDFYRI